MQYKWYYCCVEASTILLKIGGCVMQISKKNLSFMDLCVQHTKVYSKLLRVDYNLYKNWLDFLVQYYLELTKREQKRERIENATVISLLVESVDCIDGISILHQQGAINATYPLIRKLMELNFQIIQ